MSGGEVAALVAAVAFVVLVVFMVVTLVRLRSTLVSLEAMVDDLHRSTVPVLEELKETVNTVNVELERIDGIMISAESVASSASNLADVVSTAVSNPLVKGIAFLAGVTAAARRFRKARRNA